MFALLAAASLNEAVFLFDTIPFCRTVLVNQYICHVRKFNWRIFKRTTVIPLLILKVAALVIGFLGLASPIVIIGIASPISLFITTFAIVHASEILPGVNKPEEMKYVVRPHTVVIFMDSFPQGDRACILIHEYQEYSKEPDVRKVLLPKENNYRLKKGKNYRVAKDYQLFECESHEIVKPVK